jgi:hypothetical protein
MRLASAFIFVLLAACSSEQSSSSTSLTREPGECSDVEVHVIGVNDGGGDSEVVLARPGHHILVLSAYEATTWHVTTRNGAKLDRIYAVGHNRQKVVTDATTKITTESAADGGADATGFVYPDRSTEGLLKLASIRVERHATSFHGCFKATKWTIGENMAVTSDCASATSSYQTYDAVIDCDGDNTCGQDGDGDGDSGDGTGDGSLY